MNFKPPFEAFETTLEFQGLSQKIANEGTGILDPEHRERIQAALESDQAKATTALRLLIKPADFSHFAFPTGVKRLIIKGGF